MSWSVNVDAKRSIPASAGEPNSNAHPKDHGRGLSPRVRGNHSWHCHPNRRKRPFKRVYPRECGGTPGLPRLGHHLKGLSPRVRGNRLYPPATPTMRRSIPASAGEPRCACCLTTLSRVYPRECGGTMPPPPSWESRKGLSPRVRGNLLCLAKPVLFAMGSIPASAGEPQ